MSLPIKVFIGVRPSFLQIGVSQVLKRESNFSVIAESGNHTKIITLVQQLSPDVLLLNATTDIDLCNQLAADLKQRHCQLKVLFLANNVPSDWKSHPIGAIADHVFDIDQDIDLANVIYAIDRQKPRPPGQKAATAADEVSTLFQLTYREKQILDMVSKGFSNELIAKQLCLAKQTIRNYTSRIYQKIPVDSRSEAIVWVRENTRGI
ncbi:MAG: response regulator transcription factor [Phormidesmis sp.]